MSETMVGIMAGLIASLIGTWVGLYLAKKSEREKKQRAELMEAEKKGHDDANRQRVDNEIIKLWELQTDASSRINDVEKTIIRMEEKIDTVIKLVGDLAKDFRTHQENDQRRRSGD